MARIMCRKSGLTLNVEISGEATISNAKKVKDFFLSVVNSNYTDCNIDLNAVSSVDFIFTELLYSFKKSMKRVNKIIRFLPIEHDHEVYRYLVKVGIDYETVFAEGESDGI